MEEKYFMASTFNNKYVLCDAKTLVSAKREATRYYGVGGVRGDELKIAVEDKDGSIILIARRKIPGIWEDA